MKLRIKRRAWYPWLFLAICVVVLPLILFFAPEKRFEFIVAVVGTVGGLIHFLYSQHQQEVELFNVLFKGFTERYDNLNDDLNSICRRASGTPLEPQEKNILYDYFNLCAEEYLFYDAGYIDHHVWHSWCRGMMFYDDVPEIHDLWVDELRTDSYYGFSLKKIRKN
jgi:hypothetical protein